MARYDFLKIDGEVTLKLQSLTTEKTAIYFSASNTEFSIYRNRDSSFFEAETTIICLFLFAADLDNESQENKSLKKMRRRHDRGFIALLLKNNKKITRKKLCLQKKTYHFS